MYFNYVPLFLCVFQLCAPTVKVAAKLVMISGFLYRKGDLLHYNVIKWKRILRYCPLVRGIHPSPVDSLHKGTVIRTLGVSVLHVWTKCWTTVDWPVIRDDMTDIAVMYELVCISASITKWISVISKLFSNVTYQPTERQIARWKAYKFIMREIFKLWGRSQCWHITLRGNALFCNS